jgi:UDP-N-acetylglucosamine--N-acetylmuramyl-(pentapeptide) pyrophosphoryl-undecaprenol N-acetylglucosamine transferase
MNEKTILIAAGGTGGHLFPAAAFAAEMRARGWRVVLVTDARGRRYAQNFPADSIEEVPAATIQSKNPIEIGLAATKIWRGIGAAGKRQLELRPALVAGFGGYPSFSSLWAARAQKRPILIHEQNAVLGRVNRYFARNAAAIASAFDRLDRAPPNVRRIVTGNPVRAEIRAVRDAPYPAAVVGGPVNLLVTGGSQGAGLFGEVVPEAIALLPSELRARLHVVQQAREEQVQTVRAAYEDAGVASVEVAAFFGDMGARLTAAHLAIARGGASSVTELAVAGRPAIIVPGDFATDDHQTANAAGLAEVGAADVIAEGAFTPNVLAGVLRRRLEKPHDLAVRAAAARAAGRPDAAKALADLAEELALKT